MVCSLILRRERQLSLQLLSTGLIISYTIHSSLISTKYFIQFHSVFIRTSVSFLLIVYFQNILFFVTCHESTRYLQHFLFLVLQSLESEKGFPWTSRVYHLTQNKCGTKASYSVTGTRVSFINKKLKLNYRQTTLKMFCPISLCCTHHTVRNTAVVLLSCGEEAQTCQRLLSYTASYSCGTGTLAVFWQTKQEVTNGRL